MKTHLMQCSDGDSMQQCLCKAFVRKMLMHNTPLVFGKLAKQIDANNFGCSGVLASTAVCHMFVGTYLLAAPLKYDGCRALASMSSHTVTCP